MTRKRIDGESASSAPIRSNKQSVFKITLPLPFDCSSVAQDIDMHDHHQSHDHMELFRSSTDQKANVEQFHAT